MSTILAVYTSRPGFPPSDQRHDATRHEIAGYIVDAVDGLPTLAEVLELMHPRAALLRRVDEDAELVRLRHITQGVGMAMTYAEKRSQAHAVQSLGQAAANALNALEMRAQFPTLAASVGIEAATLWDCAQLVIAKSTAWLDLSNIIEGKRLAGKKSIADAADATAAKAAYEAITWEI